MIAFRIQAAFAGALLALVAAGAPAAPPPTGPDPNLPRPSNPFFLLPVFHFPDADRWPAGRMPTAAPGLRIAAFARGMDHPRSLLTLPNGDVLVAESAAPPRDPPQKDHSLSARLLGPDYRRDGEDGPSPGRILLLRDADGDGIAETRIDYITGLNGPVGMALIGSTLYVADADALLAFPYDPRAAAITAAPRRITRLPAQRNQHWMKSLAASPDGLLYVGIGANSNIAENGVWEEQERAAIWQVDPATGEHALFASGLRNPAGLAFAAGSDHLYTIVQERDGLGDDLVPDYLTRVQEGGFYGWPWSYYGDHVDRRVEPPRPDLVREAIAPDYALGPHVGAVGLVFGRGQRLGPAFANGVFVSERGTWERGSDTGFRVVFVPFAGGRPDGAPVDVLTGFVSPLNRAWGRPAGLQLARDGALLVADDAGGVIWRVTRN